MIPLSDPAVALLESIKRVGKNLLYLFTMSEATSPMTAVVRGKEHGCMPRW